MAGSISADLSGPVPRVRSWVGSFLEQRLVMEPIKMIISVLLVFSKKANSSKRALIKWLLNTRYC